MSKVISLRMPEELHEALVNGAAKDGRSLNNLCVWVLGRWAESSWAEPGVVDVMGRRWVLTESPGARA